ncbi:uncharacterized protein LOC125853764 [Solanum stenotomum]|uniref:uncharacterized protein LOC125853764 n=1 Tax=Solanum stenotomum TaxID=172797 RepID=UPI0020D0EFB2|nr:uncharacterized protein LOC125853764 [Solanum stenotomum]
MRFLGPQISHSCRLPPPGEFFDQGAMTESTSSSIAPLLLRNLLTSAFIFADKPFILLAERYKLLETIRYFLISAFLFFLRLLPSLFPCLNPSGENYGYPLKPKEGEIYSPVSASGRAESGISRALTQVLSIVNDIPVSSRKYEVVRSLAERLIDENLLEGNEALREVNCAALSAAFTRTLSQLESAMVAEEGGGVSGLVSGGGRDGGYYVGKLSRGLRAIRYYGNVVWQRGRARNQMSQFGCSAEKLAAELLWLAQKMEACGCVDEAVYMWASASHVAWLALSAEPRLQGSLVKVSAFLFKQSREIGKISEDEESTKEHLRRTNMNMLMSWLPLLCRASNGTDAPVLSISERAELDRILEQIIGTLEQEEEQEKVLSLWLHHFTYCPSSDWPNLHDCYTRWCTASRKLLLH